MLRKKLMLGLLPAALVFAAFALVPSGASATVACRVLTFGTASQAPGSTTCNAPNSTTAPANIRDQHDTTGIASQETGFGADALSSNTKGAVRFCGTITPLTQCNKTPQGYGFFGVKLQQNPVSSASVCETATGHVEFVDFQKSVAGLKGSETTASAVFSSTGTTEPERGPWTIEVKSDSTACAEAERGKVTVKNVNLYITNMGFANPVHLFGEFTGKYEQPGANCPAGGMKLDKTQAGAKTQETETTNKEFDDGAGGNAYFCWVSSNNYLYPSTAPTWSLTQGTGVWKD